MQIGRGAVYSVHAQDLLAYVGGLDASEQARLNAMHTALFEWIRRGSNYQTGMMQPECQRFTNGFANGLAAMLAIARLLDDSRRFNAVLYGTESALPVALPWVNFFNGAIYGDGDHAMACYQNSEYGFTTGVVAPGEVQDRYRAKGELQTFGYPMFTLERLINGAEILRNAGFDPYGYRGVRRQSIEMALIYYACYAKSPGFNKKVTAENARTCANYQQYAGKLVNGVEGQLLIGALRFPGDSALSALEGAAKEQASIGAFALDPIRFGKWSD